MRKWFYPAQQVIEQYLNTNFTDWSSVRQTVTNDVVYESYRGQLPTGGQIMILFEIHTPPRKGMPGVIMYFTNNTGGDHLQYHAEETHLPPPSPRVRERDTFNPDGI